MTQKRNFCAVIMAGGRGTRFWPLSREKRPKQFLRLIGDKTMIEQTVGRILPLFRRSAIYTISDGALARLVRRLVPAVPPENVIVEPQAKNTAASLILATAKIYLKNEKSVVAVLCADHMILNRKLFLRKLAAAAEAATTEEAIFTFGIPPSYPATGYGYLQISRQRAKNLFGVRFYPVLKFKEKPALEQAKQFLADGQHFWNSGMFLWRADVFARKLERYAPEFYSYWERVVHGLRKKDGRSIRAVFEEIPATSIDYALMEKAEGVLMSKGDFGWSDVGSWSSLADIWRKDSAGNVISGESLVVDSSGCILYGHGSGKLTALVGLKDIIIVDTRDALLVCKKDQDQKVREVIEALKKKKSIKCL